MDYDQAFEQFLADKRAARLSEATLTFCRRSWKLFRDYPSQGKPEVDRQVLREYLARLGERMKPVTVGTWWRGLRALLRWCVEEEMVAADPTARVKSPKADHERKVPLTNAELGRVFDAAKHPTDRAPGALMVYTGLRSGEVRELRARDVDLFGRAVGVARGKSRKPRSVPLSLEAARVVPRWASDRDPRSPWFFYSLHHDLENQQLTSSGLYQVVRDLGLRAGLRVGPHRLRHSMARSSVAQGGSAAALQRLLGYSSLAVTDRYVNLNFGDLASSHEAASPFAASRRTAGHRAGRSRSKA